MKRRELLWAGGCVAAGGAGNARAEEAGVSADGIVFGHSGILSGPLGVPVRSLLDGAGLAFDRANAQGGVAGRRIRLLALDDGLMPGKALANCQALLDRDKVFGFFCNVGSGPAAAVAPLLASRNAPLIGGYGISDSVRQKVQGTAYLLRASSARETQAILQHLQTIGITRVSIAHLDNPGGAEVAAGFRSQLAEAGLTAGAVAAVRGDGGDTVAAARALAATQSQAVVMHLAGSLPGRLMQACWALDYRPSFFGTSIVPGEIAAGVLGEQVRGLVVAQVTTYPWSEADRTVVEYRRLCQQARLPVGYYTFEGFLNGELLIEALRRCGREPTRARMHAVLRGLRMRLAGMNIDFTGGSATGSRFVELVQVTQGGRFLR